MFQERWYQEEAAEKTVEAVLRSADVHPVVAIPTAGGKSVILCKIVDRLLSIKPTSNILILSHVQEILQQDFKSLDKFFEGYADIGIYSAGLDSREICKITVAGIQSVYSRTEEFSHFDFVIIDECHLIPINETTMYRSFLNGLTANYIGLTATPFRTGHGYIYKGKGALFNELCYDLTNFENFNRLTDEGWLSQIFSKTTALKLDLKKVKTIAGDFSQKDMSKKFDRDNITEAAIIETIYFGQNYKHWLIFAIDIKHAENITKSLISKGINAVVVHSEMENRKKVLSDAKKGRYQAVVNVDILTTGFDFPAIDMIILLRPTKSPVIHVQTIGRGLRVMYAEGYDLETIEGRLEAIQNSQKPHCLVLDFAGNARRLGPINDVRIKQKGDKKEGTGEMIKVCKHCGVENHLSAKFCCNCEEEFISDEVIQKEADEVELVKKKKDKEEKVVSGWANVSEINYSLMPPKNGFKQYIRVTYTCGLSKVSEHVYLEGNGYPKARAINWVNFRWKGKENEKPIDCIEFLRKIENIDLPVEIYIKRKAKEFSQITDARF